MKYQVGFKHLFCLRLLRSAYGTFLKTGCKYQNVMISAIHRTHYIYKIIDPDICQSQITLPISIWNTLYGSKNPLPKKDLATGTSSYSRKSVFRDILDDLRKKTHGFQSLQKNMRVSLLQILP